MPPGSFPSTDDSGCSAVQVWHWRVCHILPERPQGRPASSSSVFDYRRWQTLQCTCTQKALQIWWTWQAKVESTLRRTIKHNYTPLKSIWQSHNLQNSGVILQSFVFSTFQFLHLCFGIIFPLFNSDKFKDLFSLFCNLCNFKYKDKRMLFFSLQWFNET